MVDETSDKYTETVRREYGEQFLMHTGQQFMFWSIVEWRLILGQKYHHWIGAAKHDTLKDEETKFADGLQISGNTALRRHINETNHTASVDMTT